MANDYENNKVINKVYLGSSAEGAMRNLIIDMTTSGDTPREKGTGHAVAAIEPDFILSKNVTGGTQTDNEAWSSNGRLVTGTCMFNANICGDDVREGDVIEGISFSYATSQLSSSVVHATGTFPDYRSEVGATGGSGKPMDLVITPFASASGEWTDEGYITADDTIGEHSGTRTIPAGAYGKADEGATATKILISGLDDYLGNIMKGTWVFGKEGTLDYRPEHKVVETVYLDGQVVQPSETYSVMLDVTIPATIVNIDGPETLTDPHTCYIGVYSV